MSGKINKQREPRRDRDDRAMLKHMGDPAHINGEEARLLASKMPESHGKVVTRGLLAEAGRRGDDRVTLLTDAEEALLKARGGAGTRNPKSGLLEFYSDNTSAAGENTGGMDTSSPNSGVTGNEGPSSSAGGNSGSYGADYSNNYGYDDFGRAVSKPGIANMTLDQMEAVQKQINDDIDTNYGGMYGTGFNARKDGWSSPDTWGRVLQEMWAGPAYNTPGRFGAPNAIGPGVIGTMTGFLAGGPMSLGMRAGAAMGRAQSPAQQEASMAHNQALGAKNSTGQDNDSSTGLSLAELIKNSPGGRSGSAATGLLDDAAQLGTAPGVPGVAGGGMVAPGAVGPTNASYDGRSTATGLPLPMQNLLADYLFRGRQGSGFNW